MLSDSNKGNIKNQKSKIKNTIQKLKIKEYSIFKSKKRKCAD